MLTEWFNGIKIFVLLFGRLTLVKSNTNKIIQLIHTVVPRHEWPNIGDFWDKSKQFFALSCKQNLRYEETYVGFTVYIQVTPRKSCNSVFLTAI